MKKITEWILSSLLTLVIVSMVFGAIHLFATCPRIFAAMLLVLTVLYIAIKLNGEIFKNKKTEPQTKWIPTSERLPERFSIVNIKFIPRKKSYITVATAWFDCNDGKQLWMICGAEDVYLSQSPTHWMPINQ